MSNVQRFLLFILLPMIAPMIFPPDTLAGGLALLPALVILFVALGWLVWRGRSAALTLLIFILGLNVIIRLMMLFPHAGTRGGGTVDWVYVFFSLVSIGLSMWLLLRLDRTDVRVQMVK
jgi:hypothetical protein